MDRCVIPKNLPSAKWDVYEARLLKGLGKEFKVAVRWSFHTNKIGGYSYGALCMTNVYEHKIVVL